MLYAIKTQWAAVVALACLSVGLIIVPFSDSASSAFTAGVVLLGLSLLSLILHLVLAVAGRQSESLAMVTTQLERLRRGDMTNLLDAQKIREMGKLGKYLNQCLENLQAVLSGCARASSVSADSASALQISSSTLSQAVDQTLTQLNSAAAGSEQLSQTAGEIANNCESANERAELANETAREGQAVVKQGREVMERIRLIVESSSTIIDRLGERSKDIGNIVELIRGIAGQTNLLALNAAIEAARAGEHGRGFAVVSDEVRKLASETSTATDQISDTVQAMQTDIESAVEEMKNGVDAVTSGVDESAKSSGALDKILENIELLAADIQHITRATNDQTSTTKDLSEHLHTIAGLMDNSAKRLGENLTDIDHVAQSSIALKNELGKFQLSGPGNR